MDGPGIPNGLIPSGLWNSDNIAVVALICMVAILLALLLREQVVRGRERTEAQRNLAAANERGDKAWTLILDVTSKYERAVLGLTAAIDGVLKREDE